MAEPEDLFPTRSEGSSPSGGSSAADEDRAPLRDALAPAPPPATSFEQGHSQAAGAASEADGPTPPGHSRPAGAAPPRASTTIRTEIRFTAPALWDADPEPGLAGPSSAADDEADVEGRDASPSRTMSRRGPTTKLTVDPSSGDEAGRPAPGTGPAGLLPDGSQPPESASPRASGGSHRDPVTPPADDDRVEEITTGESKAEDATVEPATDEQAMDEQVTDEQVTEEDAAETVGFDQPPEPERRGSGSGSFLRELPLLLLVALVLAFLLRTFVVQVFYIPSSSMEPTLQRDDRMVVEKLTYRFRAPVHGEILVFEGESLGEPPADEGTMQRIVRGVGQFLGVVPVSARDFVKRVVALPGDELELSDGVVFVNGQALDEPYVVFRDQSDFGPLVVPEGELFFLGDNRPNSSDSRSSLGTVPLDQVVGRSVLIIWPFDHAGLLTRDTHEVPPARSQAVDPGLDAADP